MCLKSIISALVDSVSVRGEWQIRKKVIFNRVDKAQLLNYLKATGYKIGLLVNFGSKSNVKSKIYYKTTRC